MLSQRLMSRLSQRAGQQLRSTPVRSAIQRRFASTEGKTLKDLPDNAFNRERAAVKAHAAATSGKCYLPVAMPAMRLYRLDKLEEVMNRDANWCCG
jgi:hypothetical protein